jgi:hypothetical protein
VQVGHHRRGSRNNANLRAAVRSRARQTAEELAASYIRHTAVGGLEGGELLEAETIYVLWDWDGLALLAYEQFLQRGRGVLIGPRTVEDEDSITVLFDYVPSADGLMAQILGRERALSVGSSVEHYHPEFDIVVVWLRKDGTLRHDVLRSDAKPGLRAPRDLYDLKLSAAATRVN